MYRLSAVEEGDIGDARAAGDGATLTRCLYAKYVLFFNFKFVLYSENREYTQIFCN